MHCLGRDSTFYHFQVLFLHVNFVLRPGWARWGTWCSASQKGQPSEHHQRTGWPCSWMHCFSGTGNCCPWKITVIEERSGHILHAWARQRVMQSQYNLKSERLISFALWSVKKNKPCKCTPEKHTHRSYHVAYCNAREMRNQRHWRLLLFFLSSLPANTVPIFYKATTQQTTTTTLTTKQLQSWSINWCCHLMWFPVNCKIYGCN